MMTKKNYKRIAEIINEAIGNTGVYDSEDGLNELANNLANYFKEDNPNFDRVKWNKAILN